MHPEIERAHAAQVPYVEPQSLADPEGRQVRQHPNATLDESFETQRHIGTRDGRRTQTYAGALLPPPPEDSRDPILAWFLTAWNPFGRPCTLEENQEAQRRLLTTIEAGGRNRPRCRHDPPARPVVGRGDGPLPGLPQQTGDRASR